MWLIRNGRYLWQKVLYNALTLVYMAVYNLIIKNAQTFSVFFKIDLFVFLTKISSLYNFI